MNAYDYPTIVIKLQSEIDRKISEFEQVCFDIKSSSEITAQARIRRLQLLAVRDLIDMKSPTL